MGLHPQRRFALGRLLGFLPPRYAYVSGPQGLQMHAVGPRHQLASAAGVSRRTIDRWAAEGLPESAADRCAIAIGLHPALIWDEWSQ